MPNSLITVTSPQAPSVAYGTSDRINSSTIVATTLVNSAPASRARRISPSRSGGGSNSATSQWGRVVGNGQLECALAWMVRPDVEFLRLGFSVR